MDVNLSVPALDKLVDYAASGIGSVAGPMLAPWQARREAKAKQIAAEGDAKALTIQAEAQSEARNTLVSKGSGLAVELDITDKVNQRVLFQEQKRQLNIEKVVRKAADELGDKTVANKEPDHDWTARFFNDVQDVSTAEMQILWARVLAGEVERANSTSIRTLGILKNLDQATANLFRTFCSACAFIGPIPRPSDGRVPSLGKHAAQNSLRDYGLDFASLNLLNENGLILSEYNSVLTFTYCHIVGDGDEIRFLDHPFRFQNKYWILTRNPQPTNNNTVKIPGVALTSSGIELSQIVDIRPTEKFAQDLIAYFRKQNLQMTEVSSGVPRIRP